MGALPDILKPDKSAKVRSPKHLVGMNLG